MKEDLFADFQSFTKEDWISQATKDIKGKDFEKTLIARGFDGIDLFPFYTREDLDNIQGLQNFQNQINPVSEIPGMGVRYWSNTFAIKVQNETLDNKRVLEALMNGADALLIKLDGKVDFGKLLEGVNLKYIQVFLEISVDLEVQFDAFIEWYLSLGEQAGDLKGGLLWDPISSCLSQKSTLSKISDQALSFLSKSQVFESFRIFSVDASRYHNAGATPVQELFMAIGGFIELVDILTENGISPKEIFSKTMLQAAAGSHYFLEIAKLRSFKILFHQLAALYELDLSAGNTPLFVSTSYWTKTKADVHSNMLRSTTEAMAAILGGCDALWVRPHDETTAEDITSFSERMARNISNILKEESYMDKVLDPVAGTYFLENITDQYNLKIKRELQILESKGGWWQTYQKNELQDLVKAARYEKLEAVKSGVRVKVGVNKYQAENIETDEDFEWKEEKWQLLPVRESFLIEYPKLVKP
jgi:methylmalonyl-CoA mutase